MNSHGSSTRLLQQLSPIIPQSEKRRFWVLQAFTLLQALSELALTGLVALLAATFGSPETVYNNNPLLWLRMHLGFELGRDPRMLALAALCAILAVIVWKNVLTIFQQRQLTFFSESVGAAARCFVFRFYQRAPFLWTQSVGIADMTFSMSAASSLATILAIILQVLTSILTIVTLFVGLVIISPIPTLLFLLILGLGGGLIIKAIRKTLKRCANTVYTEEYASNKIIYLGLYGLKEMRLYGRENKLFLAFKEQMGRIISAKAHLQTIARLPVCSLEILGFCTLVSVMLFLIFVQNAGIARISGIMGFMAAAAWRCLPVTNRLVDSISSIQSNLPYLQRLSDLVDQEKRFAGQLMPIEERSESTAFDFSRDITLERISFRYPDATINAVDDVSIIIEAGSMVGVVGLSGAGKSTLVNILTGLISPDIGRVTVDGVPITNESSSGWLRKIGYVSQTPYILGASLAENIALSRWGEIIDRDRVVECCRMAALDFLDDLKDGIDTILGDRGASLSGGQAQRVAIARALYSDPNLIIFDEATSALDMKNEKAILDTILSLRRRVTLIIIAHRLSTVENCDRIVWLERGKVLRQGSAGAVLPHYKSALNAAHEGPLETPGDIHV